MQSYESAEFPPPSGLLLPATGAFVPVVSATYTAAKGVVFDGSASKMTRADFSGDADASTGLISFWFKLDGGDGATAIFFCQSSSQAFQIRRNSSNKIEITLSTASFSDFLIYQSSGTYTAGATWYHLLASWNVNFSSGSRLWSLYVNDADTSPSVSAGDVGAAFNVDYTGPQAIGTLNDGTQWLNGELAEFWWYPGQYLDLSVSSNRRKFISATGKPVDLGSDGSTPLGSAPICYLKGPAANFATNLGTGGNFTVGGSLTDGSTGPSD